MSFQGDNIEQALFRCTFYIVDFIAHFPSDKMRIKCAFIRIIILAILVTSSSSEYSTAGARVTEMREFGFLYASVIVCRALCRSQASLQVQALQLLISKQGKP